MEKQKQKQLIIVGKNESRILWRHPNELWLGLKDLGRKQDGLMNISSIFSGLTGKAAPAKSQAAPGYGSLMTIEQGDTAFNTAAKVYALAQVAAGVTARIFEFSVPPRYQYAWGSGTHGLSDNQGYMWLAILKAGTGFQTHLVNLAIESYDRHTMIPVFESADPAMHLPTFTTLATATPSDHRTMLSLPETTVLAAPYSRLAINAKVLVAQATLDSAGFGIPVTAYSG